MTVILLDSLGGCSHISTVTCDEGETVQKETGSFFKSFPAKANLNKNSNKDKVTYLESLGHFLAHRCSINGISSSCLMKSSPVLQVQGYGVGLGRSPVRSVPGLPPTQPLTGIHTPRGKHRHPYKAADSSAEEGKYKTCPGSPKVCGRMAFWHK